METSSTRRLAQSYPLRSGSGGRAVSLDAIHGNAWRWTLVVAVTMTALASGLELLSTREAAPETALPAVRSTSILNAFADHTPIEVTTTAAWQKVRVTVPAYALVSDRTLWRKMNFDDWDTVPEPLRRTGLTAMWDCFAVVVHSPPAWDRMTARDWDEIPPPVRAMAYIQMIKYWSGYYQVGLRYAVPRGMVTDTMAAIVMKESWFEHRGTHTNPDGGRDIGLGACSEYCRGIMARLGRAGVVDFEMSDDHYFNPWRATRVVVVWFELMLEEAKGDLDLAVRSYHRGWPLASRGEGEAYLADVKRLRRRYIRNEDGSPAWQFLFAHAFATNAI